MVPYFLKCEVKIPKRVRITAKSTYAVTFVDVIDDNPELYGICDSGKMEIQIRNGLSEKLKIETFLHELAHALEFEWGVPIPHRVIYSMEEPVFKLLKLNGWI